MRNKVIVAGMTATLVFGAPSVAFAHNGPPGHEHGKQPDPCPGQHIPVYTDGQNNPNHHYVCGAPGTPGPAGPQGPKGDEGPAGPAGKDGSDGKDGVSNVPGPQGPAGPEGPRGFKGEDGADGKDGVDGKDGSSVNVTEVEPGLVCAAGGIEVKPENDEVSYIICNGTHGEDGAPGADGANGEDGADGQDGANGEDGANGKNGKDGISKTVVIEKTADGGQKVTTIGELPKTGGEDATMWLLAGGLAIAGGGAAAYWYGRRK